MSSFDVSSLFTNIPLSETIEIAIERLYQNKEIVNNITKVQFRKLLNFAVKDNHFLFDGEYYVQRDGVANWFSSRSSIGRFVYVPVLATSARFFTNKKESLTQNLLWLTGFRISHKYLAR